MRPKSNPGNLRHKWPGLRILDVLLVTGIAVSTDTAPCRLTGRTLRRRQGRQEVTDLLPEKTFSLPDVLHILITNRSRAKQRTRQLQPTRYPIGPGVGDIPLNGSGHRLNERLPEQFVDLGLDCD